MSSTADIQSLIVSTAAKYGVPANLALGVASHESGFNPNATNYNANGTTDWGVMQLNDTTVQTLGVQNPLDPAQNINAGVSLLASYLQKYGGDVSKTLQAYMAGPGNVQSGPPSSAVQSFINYVTGYGGGSQPAASTDYADAVTQAASNGVFSGLDFTDPVTLFGVGIAVVGLTWLLTRA